MLTFHDQPCCTVNHPQAYPKFLANSFVEVDSGIGHVFLVPGRLNTKLGDKDISITADTAYPFALSLTYHISASHPFFFYIRIPTWANSNSTISMSYEETSSTTPVSPRPDGLHEVFVPPGTVTISVQLSTAPRIVSRENNTAAIYYGALLYSLAIEYTSTASPPRNYRNESALLPNSTVHAHTHDHALVPTSVWNVAIDPSQITVLQREVEAGSKLANPVWALGAPPIELRVAAVEIEWPLAFDSPAAPPKKPKVVGRPFSARFVPFGSAKLHMSLFPVVSLPEVARAN
jgi:hypothetical protein